MSQTVTVKTIKTEFTPELRRKNLKKRNVVKNEVFLG